MSGDVNCPYCGTSLEINHDDGYGYEEDQLFEQECAACGKTFAYATHIEVYHEAKRADCLNGAAHQYEQTVTYPPEYSRLQCRVCGNYS